MPRTLPTGHRSVVVSSDASVEATAALIAEVAERHRLLEAVEIRVPNDLQAAPFGGVGAIVQALITWARNDRERIVHTYLNDDVNADEVYEDLVRQDHLLVACLLAKRILSNGRVDITREARAAADSVLATQDADPVARRRAFITCLDDYEWHSVSPWLYQGTPTRRWLNDPFSQPARWPYSERNPARVRTASALAEDFLRFADRLGMYGSLAELEPTFFYQLAVATSEIFDNTHRWARRAPLLDHPMGQTFRPSVRGIRMSWIDDSAETARKRGAGDEVLRSFLQRSTEGVSRQSYVEMSVFDSGPGVFARRVHASGVDWRTAPIQAQLTALTECLTSESTDDPSGAGEERGNGFTRAMTYLSELGGYFRIRTGQLSLGRDLGSDTFSDSDLTDPWLRDTATAEARTASTLGRVAGTGVLMVFPVRRS